MRRAESGPDVNRLREVVETFMTAGFDILASRMRIARCASLKCRMHCTFQRWMGRRAPAQGTPEALREVLISLGPAFVKVGQILSVRSDLVPPDVATALRDLQSNVPPADLDRLRPSIEAAMGGPIPHRFRRFEVRPLAAASLAQVHEAELLEGRRVAVKVKRPDIDALVAKDLEILVWLARQAEAHLPGARAYRPVAAAEELRRYTLRELDFTNEARVAAQIRQALEHRDDVVIPEPIIATPDVLVMDFVESFPIDDLDRLSEHGIDPKALLRRGMSLILAQIFEVGSFHADPHPGNLHVTADGRVAMLDFGIFGRLNEHLLRTCALLMWTLSRGDVELSSYFLLRAGSTEPWADVHSFRRGIEDRYRAWLGSTVSEYGFATLIWEEFSLAARHGIVLPSDLVLFGKAMLTVEGIALTLDPELDIAAEAAPYLERLQTRLFSTEHLMDRWARSAPLWWDVMERLPLGLAEITARSLLLTPPDIRSEPDGPGARFYFGAAFLALSLTTGAVSLALGDHELLGTAALVLVSGALGTLLISKKR